MSDLDPAIWAPMPIAPMPMLAYLRVCVLSRSAKRMPKWKFRVSPDTVTEVQRRSSSFAAAFHCKAVVHDEAGAELLTDRQRSTGLMDDRIQAVHHPARASRFHR